MISHEGHQYLKASQGRRGAVRKASAWVYFGFFFNLSKSGLNSSLAEKSWMLVKTFPPFLRKNLKM